MDTNIQQYLVNTSKVDFLAHRSLLQSLYGEQHPCGKVVVEEDYHAITPEVLRNFYERYYHSGNCSIFLSGKVTEGYYSTGEGYVRLSIRAISVADIEIKFPLYCRARETDFYGTGRCDAKCRKNGIYYYHP